MATHREARAHVQDGVIQTRLAVPSLPVGLVSRTRLHDRLDAHPARLVLVSAPAGFGKTALVLDWMAQRGLHPAWLSVDRSDNDPTRFFNHFAAALERLPVSGAERAASLVRTLASGPAADGAVLEAFGALGSDVVVVLDDVHEIEEPRVLRPLEQLLSPRGPGPRVLLLTRVDPPLPLGRLRVSGELLELRERDLRFTGEECASLFSVLLPGALGAEQIEQLEVRTEGWAAGLRLAAIALQGVPDAASAVASFAGSHRLVVDYLVEEAIEKQSPAVQQFLLDTSVLERFTEETCRAVTAEPDAAARLAEVEAANLFLVPLGSDRQWFRYHHLFRELLQFRLRRLQPQRSELLERRASEWFAAAGDMHAAIEHASRMEDRTRLRELLDEHAFDILATSELSTFQRWLRRLPDPLGGPYPTLIVGIGWLRVLTERSPQLQPVFDAAEAALGHLDPAYAASRRVQARLRLDVLRGFEARFAGRLEEAILISRAALQDVPDEDAFTHGLLTFNLARLEMLVGRMDTAAELLERSFEHNVRAGTTYLQLTSLGQRAAVLVQLEGVHRAREELKTAVAFATQRHRSGVPAFSAVLYHSAHVEYVANRLDDAEQAAERAAALARAGSFPEGYGNALMLQARVAVARGRFDAAEALLTELAALARDENLVLLDTTVALEQARFALTREQRGGGPPASMLELSEQAGCWTTYREAEVTVCLRHALHARQYERAAALAALLQAEAEARGRGLALCVALLAQAILPDREDRWELLARALRLAGTRGYVRPLIDAGEVVRALLESGLNQALPADARAYARVLLAHLDQPDPAAATAPTPSALVESLTGREADVLEYLCQGLSNKAIARALFVSGETVKTHLKHLYWKLGVAGRDQAVARARELGLVPRVRA